MFCTKCGKEIKEGMKHCPFCGEIVQKGSTAKAAVSDAKKPKKMKVILIIIALLLIGGMYNAITENTGGKSLEYSFEVSDNDLLNLLGMATKDVEKLYDISKTFPASDNVEILSVDGFDYLELYSKKNRIIGVTSSDETQKVCGISAGDKESDAIKQMDSIGATLVGKTNYDDMPAGFEAYELEYSIKSNSVTFRFTVDANTKRISIVGVYME